MKKTVDKWSDHAILHITEQGACIMNNKKMKDKLKEVDQAAARVTELEKEFDLGNLSHRIHQARVEIVDKIGRKE